MDEIPEAMPIRPQLPITRAAEPVSANAQIPVAAAIRSLRVKSGLSQRQLAMRMGVPRTYVSKIENEKACPTLGSLERLADALRVRVCDLLTTGHTLQDEVRGLMNDDFIAELVPYMTRLNGVQWMSVMTQVRELSAMTRRTA